MRRSILGSSILAAGFSIALWSSTPQAQEVAAECLPAVGTYLTKNNLPDAEAGPHQSRSLISLTNGGHAFRDDSDQNAGEDGGGFGDGRGVWRCDGRQGDRVSISATILNFAYPGPQQPEGRIARIDYDGTFDASDETLRLSGKLFFVPLGEDPYAMPVPGDAISVDTVGTKIRVP